MLLENPSTYVAFAESTCAETDFLREIARRTGCGLLLDVNNVFVSATNHGFDPDRYLADFPLPAVGEIHLAGYAEDTRRRGPAAPDRRPQFAGSRRRLVALRRRRSAGSGPTPTLIEWDNDLPAWPTLLGEARRAERADRRDRGARSAPMPFETTIAAFAAALDDPSARPPAMTRGRFAAPDTRRFSVYRNNVAVGLIGALEARYPVSRRIAGDEMFRAHGARVRSRAEAALAGDDRLWRGFPEFLAACEGIDPRLADVARLENAWVEAYHAEDAPAATIGELAALRPNSLPGDADRVSPRGAPPALLDARRLDLGRGAGLRQPAAPSRGHRRGRACHPSRLRRPRARPAAARL